MLNNPFKAGKHVELICNICYELLNCEDSQSACSLFEFFLNDSFNLFSGREMQAEKQVELFFRFVFLAKKMRNFFSSNLDKKGQLERVVLKQTFVPTLIMGWLSDTLESDVRDTEEENIRRKTLELLNPSKSVIECMVEDIPVELALRVRECVENRLRDNEDKRSKEMDTQVDEENDGPLFLIDTRGDKSRTLLLENDKEDNQN